jgi:hypothetical protein
MVQKPAGMRVPYRMRSDNPSNVGRTPEARAGRQREMELEMSMRGSRPGSAASFTTNRSFAQSHGSSRPRSAMSMHSSTSPSRRSGKRSENHENYDRYDFNNSADVMPSSRIGRYALNRDQIDVYEDFMRMISNLDKETMMDLVEDVVKDAQELKLLSKYGGDEQ